MATMKRVFIFAILFLVPALARADSIVYVVIQPATFVDITSPKTETVSGSFLWDTTTQVLSNIIFTETGAVRNWFCQRTRRFSGQRLHRFCELCAYYAQR